MWNKLVAFLENKKNPAQDKGESAKWCDKAYG